MVIIKYDRLGIVTELSDNDSYEQLVDTLNELSEELESEGIFLIKERATNNLTRTLEFASVKNGWECVLVLAHGYVKSINSKI